MDMNHKSATGFLCLCLLAQQLFCSALVLHPGSVVPPGHSSAASKTKLAAQERWKMWNRSKMLELEGDLVRLQHKLEQSRVYEDIRQFIDTAHCGNIVAPKEMINLPGGVILTTLSYFALLIAEGCPQPAIDAAYNMVNEMTRNMNMLPEQIPVVTESTNCSREGDMELRHILFEDSFLLEVYTMVAGGVHGSLGCNNLVSAILPALVRYSYTIANVPRRSEPLVKYENEEDKLQHYVKSLEGLAIKMKDRGLIGVTGLTKRQSGSDCEKPWEKTINDAIKNIPILNALWHVGSAIGYGIAGCSQVAAERGKSAASSLLSIVTVFFQNQ